MMALPTVNPDDVAKRYDGDLSSEFDQTYIETQIGDAVDYVTSRWRARVEARLASGDLTENLFKRVISDAVLRVARNPGGLASENEGGYGYSTRATVASGNLWFTDDDVLTLCGPLDSNFPGTIGIGLDRGWR